MKVISVSDASKSFPNQGSGLLRQQLGNFIGGRHKRDRFYALKNISFEVSAGESVAIIGRNGSGKSTILSLVCGLTFPDTGSVNVHGRVAALLDLGSGFHFDLTGTENLRLNASLVGLSRRRTEEVFGSIVEFSELGDFIHQPLRTYSHGMVMRLAFSVALHLDPDVLIIDEVLAVGDRAFQKKCFDKMLGFRQMGHTLLVVSHNAQMLRAMCSRAVWLDHGRMVLDGSIDTVLDLYEQSQATADLVLPGSTI